MDRKYKKVELNIKPGVYLLGETIVVAAEDPFYLASKPNMGLRPNKALAQQLRTPTSAERSALSENDSALEWFTLQTQKGPNVRRVVDDFLDLN
jgi:hypothetical protein